MLAAAAAAAPPPPSLLPLEGNNITSHFASVLRSCKEFSNHVLANPLESSLWRTHLLEKSAWL